MIPELCSHLQQNPERPYAGLPDENGLPAFYCPACFASRIEQLVGVHTLPDIIKMIHVPMEHISTVAGALHGVSKDLRNDGESRLANRVRDISKRLYARLERRFNFADPNWRPRYVGPTPIREPRSLSSFSDVVVYNKRVLEPENTTTP